MVSIRSMRVTMPMTLPNSSSTKAARWPVLRKVSSNDAGGLHFRDEQRRLHDFSEGDGFSGGELPIDVLEGNHADEVVAPAIIDREDFLGALGMLCQMAS